MTTFADLNLSSHLLRTLADEGYSAPTPIQAQTIVPALEGRDVLGCAQTGTGKTAAFALPIIQQLMQSEPPRAEAQEGGPRKGRSGSHGQRRPVLPRALILSPTRELAGQITDSFTTYGRGTPLRHTAIYGGVSQRGQERALRQGVDIIVATPGRLIDLMDQRLLDLSHVRIFTLDEADRMLDMGFIDPLRRIARALPEPRQTLLFSATMPPKVAQLAHSLLRDPVKVSVARSKEADPQIEQVVYRIGRHDKQELLERLIQSQQIERAVVFTKTKHGAEKVRKRLAAVGISADAIHGNKSQNQRQRALDGFRRGKCHVLVATDVAARGLDVDGVTHVFNFDLPIEAEAYVHRIGRTARAGATGQAVAFCSPEERPLLNAIERLTGKRLPLATDSGAGPRQAHPEYDEEQARQRAIEATERRRRQPGGPRAQPPASGASGGSANSYGGNFGEGRPARKPRSGGRGAAQNGTQNGGHGGSSYGSSRGSGQGGQGRRPKGRPGKRKPASASRGGGGGRRA